MKLAVVTEDALTKSHGTGNLLLRLLDGAALSVTGFFPGPASGHPPVPSIAARRHRTLAGVRAALRHRLRAFLPQRALPPRLTPHWRFALDAAGADRLREADLILAVVHTAAGLHFVHDLLASVPGRPQVVLWFMDLLTSPAELGNPDRSLPRFKHARIWAFNARIKASLAELFPTRRAEIELHMFLGVPVPKRRERTVRGLSADTQCVMIGNVWDTSVLPILGDIWSRACAIHGFDLELTWYGPPEALARVQHSGVRLDRRIRYAGHAPDLNALLSEADAAIVAFANPAVSSTFSRHSFPSRVADFGANGLPVFAICSDDTALADYLRESGAGLHDAARSVEAAAQACARFLADVPLRDRCARQARQYAETHFDLDQQRIRFVSELQR